ncbi:MAG: acyl-CoA dehydrogenase family protein [Pyrobaculum sp.]
MFPHFEEVHMLVKKTVREFVEKRVEPNARRIDQGWYPRDLLREMGALGLLAPHAPPEYGGPGLDFRSMVLVVEEVAKSSPALATIAEVQGAMIVYNLMHYATSEAREKWLQPAVRGERIIAFALSEPCCGSDAFSLETKAEKRGGSWVINGTKLWITSGMYADAFLVAARTGSPEEKHKTVTLFLVERGKCVEVTPVAVMGMRGTGTAEVKFRDCEVGDDAVVGGVNGAFKVVLDDLNNGRMCVGAIGLGIAQGAIREALSYAKKRRAFGTTIVNFQAVQHHLASIAAQIEAVRGVVYTAAYFRDKGSELFPLYAQVAKYLGSRLAVDAARTAMQVMGGYGYSTDSKVEMLYRDAKATEIYEGANEIILNTIFRLFEKHET